VSTESKFLALQVGTAERQKFVNKLLRLYRRRGYEPDVNSSAQAVHGLVETVKA
jgi:hypothetical protein